MADHQHDSRIPPSSMFGLHNSQQQHHSSLEEETYNDGDNNDRLALMMQPPSATTNSGGYPGDEDYGFSHEEKKDGSITDPSLHNTDDDGGLHNNSKKNNVQKSKTSSNSLIPTFSLTRSLPSTSLLMKRLGHILAISSTAIFLLIVFPLLFNSAIHDVKQGRADFAAFYSAAAFVVFTCVFSFREILSHLYNWYAPDVQKFVVRILFMVPLYSVQSWLSLRFHGPARVYIDTIRDLYEAYVIQSFVYYLIELLGGEERMAELLSRKDASFGHHGKVMSKILVRWEMGQDFLLKIKHGVLQYVVIKMVMTLLTTFVLLPSGYYGEGTFSWHSAYVYITAILQISVVYALYCLVKLFHAVKEDLRSPVNWHPVGKFLCVKGVVFFTWWQGVGIYFLRSHGVIGDVGSWSGDDVAGGIIDYLVCVEMMFFSIAHMFTFTYKEYLPEGMEEKKKSGIVGWLFEGIDKRRRNTHGSSLANLNNNQQPELQSALLGIDEEEVIPCIDESGNIAEPSYRPPPVSGSGFSRLENPLSLRQALWSSTVPRETLDDIKRLGVVSGTGYGGYSYSQADSGEDTTAIDISLSSMNNAESI